MKTSLGIAASLGLATIGGWLAGPTAPVVHPVVRTAALDSDSTAASQSLVGQLRTSSAAWLYLRADLYLHNGVELRPLTDDESRDGRRAVGSSDRLVESDARAVTVVPDDGRDFRGLFGSVERATSTYKPMEGHGHQSPIQALPLFRLMTLVDPQFITGWTMGAQILRDEKNDPSTAKALALLEQGLRENPGCLEILTAIGIAYAANLKQYDVAATYFEKARAGGAAAAHLSGPESEALEESYRWLALIAKERGTDFDRVYVAREGLKRFPDDPLLQRLGE